MVTQFQRYSISTSNRSGFTAQVSKSPPRGCVSTYEKNTERPAAVIVRAAWWFASRWNPSGRRPDGRIASRRPNQRNPRQGAGIPLRLGRVTSSRADVPPLFIAGWSSEEVHRRFRFSPASPQPDIPTEKRRVARRTGRAFFCGSRIRVDVCAWYRLLLPADECDEPWMERTEAVCVCVYVEGSSDVLGSSSAVLRPQETRVNLRSSLKSRRFIIRGTGVDNDDNPRRTILSDSSTFPRGGGDHSDHLVKLDVENASFLEADRRSPSRKDMPIPVLRAPPHQQPARSPDRDNVRRITILPFGRTRSPNRQLICTHTKRRRETIWEPRFGARVVRDENTTSCRRLASNCRQTPDEVFD